MITAGALGASIVALNCFVDACSEAPIPVAALMATAVLNCSLYALARFYVLTAHCLGAAWVSQLLVVFGLLSIGIAVPFVLIQRSYRRLLAYSSIDHGGIMVLGLGFGGTLGPLGMLLHMTFHSVIKPLLFFCAGNAQQHTGNDSLKRSSGGLLHPLPVTGPMFLLAIYNHVADIGAVATDVGFVVANAHASRLREMILGLNEELTGSRLLRGMVCPGGVRWDWPDVRIRHCLDVLDGFEREFADLMRIIDASDSTRDRLERNGILHPDKARDLGIVGVAGRASGVDRDVRRDHPYAAYDAIHLQVPVYQEGDVLRRVQVRVDEVRQSLAVIRAVESGLTPGAYRIDLPPLTPDRCALGAVEGWRGEILHWIRTGPQNRLERAKIKDPSLNNWPALVEAVQGNIVPDFPVINKSFNLSYSGTDR